MIESIVFFLLGGASYLAGRSYDRSADTLASVLRIREFKDLEPLLKSQNRLMVALRGKVGSETPMNCEFSKLQGVVVEKRVLKYFLERIKKKDKGEKEDKKKKKDKGDEWRKDYEVLHSTSKQVPWYLDDGTFRVNVVGARSAEGFYCTHRYAVFEPSRSWHGVETLDDLENLPYITKGKEDRQVLGVKRIERVLPIGTSLSVIGEAVKDGNGTIYIQRPAGGVPFYVSPRTIDQLTEGQRGDARVFYGGSVVLTLLGVAYIGQFMLQLYVNRLPSKDSSVLFSRAQYALFKGLEQHKMLQDGILWCLGGGALFLLGCYNDRYAELYFLERIKNVDKDEDKDSDDIWMKTHKLLNSTTQEVPRYLAVKDGNGTISIRAPDGGPFYVSPHTIDQLTGDSRIWARCLSLLCYVAAFGLTVYSAVQIAKHSI
ncbi:unnamed protein product [Prunus brigantina]